MIVACRGKPDRKLGQSNICSYDIAIFNEVKDPRRQKAPPRGHFFGFFARFLPLLRRPAPIGTVLNSESCPERAIPDERGSTRAEPDWTLLPCTAKRLVLP